MTQTYSLAEARKNLSNLLKRVQKDPSLRVRITVNGIAVGDLVSPSGVETVQKSAFKAKGRLLTKKQPAFRDFQKAKDLWKDPLL